MDMDVSADATAPVPSLANFALKSVLTTMYTHNPDEVLDLFLSDSHRRAAMRRAVLRNTKTHNYLGNEDIIEIMWCTFDYQQTESVKLGAIPHRIAAAIRHIYERKATNRKVDAVHNWEVVVSSDGRVEIHVKPGIAMYEGLKCAYEHAVREEMACEGVESKCEDLDKSEIDPADFGAMPDTLAWDAYECHAQGMEPLDEAMDCELAAFFEEPVTVTEVRHDIVYGDGRCALAKPVALRDAFVRKPRVRMIVIDL
jgi:hypothetical protein